MSATTTDGRTDSSARNASSLPAKLMTAAPAFFSACANSSRLSL
jgi:hypothetical protein